MVERRPCAEVAAAVGVRRPQGRLDRRRVRGSLGGEPTAASAYREGDGFHDHPDVQDDPDDDHHHVDG